MKNYKFFKRKLSKNEQRIWEYVQRISVAGNSYLIRELTIIDDSWNGELQCTLWGDQALNYIANQYEVVLVKHASVSIGPNGEKKVSLTRVSSTVHGLKDKRTTELGIWMTEQLNFQAGIDTPSIKTLIKSEGVE